MIRMIVAVLSIAYVAWIITVPSMLTLFMMLVFQSHWAGCMLSIYASCCCIFG